MTLDDTVDEASNDVSLFPKLRHVRSAPRGAARTGPPTGSRPAESMNPPCGHAAGARSERHSIRSVDEEEMLAKSSAHVQRPASRWNGELASAAEAGHHAGPLGLLVAVLIRMALGRDPARAEKRAQGAWTMIGAVLILSAMIAVLIRVLL